MNAWKRQNELDRIASNRASVRGWEYLNRREMLRAAVVGLGGVAAMESGSGRAEPSPNQCAGDIAVDSATALVYAVEMPLLPGKGLRRCARGLVSCSRKPR